MISRKTPYQNVGYASLAGGGICLVFAILLGNPWLIFTASIAFGASFCIFKYGYLIGPLFTTKARIAQVWDDVEIPPAQNILIKKAGPVYYATVFLGVTIFESVQDKSVEQKAAFTEMFERLLADCQHVFSLTSLVFSKDVHAYRSKINTARMESEIRLTQFKKSRKPDWAAVQREKRRIGMYEQQLESLTRGARPMGLLFFLKTTAAGLTRQEAIDKAMHQGSELKTGVSNALGCDVQFLSGDSMKRCFEWEKMLPVSPEELEDQLI